MSGQGEADIGGRSFRRRLGAAALAAFVLTGFGALAQDPPRERPTPSGLPVPRYVTLKFGTVNARAGPGDDHRLLWIYRAQGLPVQVVAETREWRRICDPEGGLAWVHRRTTDGRRMVMRTKDELLPMRRAPRSEAAAVAYLNPRALAALVRCKDGWCRIRADGVAGWAPAAELWGVQEQAQCR